MLYPCAAEGTAGCFERGSARTVQPRTCAVPAFLFCPTWSPNPIEFRMRGPSVMPEMTISVVYSPSHVCFCPSYLVKIPQTGVIPHDVNRQEAGLPGKAMRIQQQRCNITNQSKTCRDKHLKWYTLKLSPLDLFHPC